MNSWTADDTELFCTYGDAFVPRRGEQYAAICASIDPLLEQAVLELGCGAGLLTAAILQSQPAAVVTALDSSESMLAMARRQVAHFADRVSLCRGDLRDSAWCSGRYGAVVTSLAVHHLDDEAKRDLMRAVYDLLVPGGVFVQADLIRPATPATTTLAAATWDASVADQSVELFGNNQAHIAFQRSRWNTFRFPDPVDQPATVVDNVLWLRRIGFGGIDVPWAFAGHAIVSAVRPATADEGAGSAE
ncbi:class I SAM-dependent methyltransferase [Nocardia abscessus]|uniref:class I SAM-dependent methyltransferase n=1 Tax=Nocardia abscessus TaxID=120957 RepID=UPI002457F992|nr:class I SAM-dependent methyltransferase [Nocardia abscessus]